MKFVARIAKWLAVLVYAACAVVIVASVLPVGGWKVLDVLTGSMRPGIQPGDLVIIHKVPLSDIHSGDIVTYTNPTNPMQTITHRIVSMPVKDGLQMVVTKGDANPIADPPFAGGRIVGREVAHVPFAGKITNTLHNPIALLGLIVIPGMLVIFGEIQALRGALSEKSEPTQTKNDPPDQQPPAGPPPSIKREVKTARPTRRLDGMGPRSLALLMLVSAIPVGITYAKTITNPVNAQGKVVVLAAPTSANDCKNGGWQKYKKPDGSQRFKNQGDCVSFVNSNGHSHVTNITNITNITISNQSTQTSTTGSVTQAGNTAVH